MKTAVLVTALAGLASAAAADSLVVDITFADSAIQTGETTTVTMMARFEVDGSQGGYLGVAAFDLIANNSALGSASDLVHGTWNNVGQELGEVDGAGINDFKMGQSGIFGPTDDSNPLFIMSFTFTASSESGILSYSGIDPALYAFGVIDLADGKLAEPSQFDVSVISSGRLLVNVPTPGSFAMLGLGGLVATRRRR